MTERKRPKAPRAAVTTSTAKRPATAAGVVPSRDEVMQRRLVWRFADVDHEARWNFSRLGGTDLVEVLVKLGSFESMTVREVFYTGDDPGKEYDVATLPAPARARLAAVGREDETKLARLRLGGAPRLYGFMREHVFHILWWDPTHQVYPSRKKHT